MNEQVGNPYWQLRSRLLLALFGIAALGLLVRALSLQVLDDGFLTGQARARHQRVVELPAHRGMITDRYHEPLAVSTPVDSIWVNPKQILEDKESVLALVKALNLDARAFQKRLNEREDKEFLYVARHMAPNDAARVMALKLPGVYTQREYRRYYPAGEVMAHVLGFTNIDDRGQEGLERVFDGWLRGEPGHKLILRDRMGRTIDNLDQLNEPRPGHTLALSIDRRLQYIAYRELKATVAQYHAKSASMVVLDPRTGEVLAMVNQPSFNPNNRSDLDADHYRNRAVTDVFEPGSSFKPFIMAAALEAKAIPLNLVIDTNPGWYMLQGHMVRDIHNYGRLTLTDILRVSSNVGTSRIALQTNPQTLWGTLKSFGMGEVTNSGFPGERQGYLGYYSHWRPLDRATLAFGYGVSVTALQLAKAYAILAADGVTYPITFLRRDEGVTGQRVISESTAQLVRNMLEQVVAAGTGTRAAVAGYTVAGKTGTARKSSGGSYAEKNYLSVFAGMVPAKDPRLVGVVIVNEPQGGHYYGGEVAAPAFGRVMAEAVRLLDIAPDALPPAGVTKLPMPAQGRFD